MKLSSALLLLTSAVLGVRPSSAQGEPKYLEVGTTLTLEPDVSTVPRPINSIRWKYGTALVVDWDPSGHTYYGSFKGRTTLDPQTLRLDINRLTLADSGQFSLETNLGTVGSHEVNVIKPPPTPSIKTQTLCNVSCDLKCTADTQDLGPVSYEWKEDEGKWTEGDTLKNISSSDTPEKLFCRLKTRVRTSNTSLPMENPLYKPPGAATEGGAVAGPTSSPGVTEDGTRDGLTSGDIFGIIITLCIVAVIAAVIFLLKCRPEHPFSIRIKKWIPFYKKPADPVLVNVVQTAVPVQTAVQAEPAVQVEPADQLQPAVPVQTAVPVQPAVQVQPADQLQPAVPVQTAVPVQIAVPVQPTNPGQPDDPFQPAVQVQPANGVAELESLLPQQPVTGDLEMETLNNPDSNEDL
uniref:Ig-like domain-containing protein n=1 Tax=Gadus morhua TaxID=8049 RepID=A0A8C5C8H8_GADMO